MPGKVRASLKKQNQNEDQPPSIHDHHWNEILLALQSETLEDVALGRPLKYVLDRMLLSIEAQCEHMSASILIKNHDNNSLCHGSAPSLPKEYIQAIDGVQIGDNVGSCGTAAYLNRPVIVEDIANDKRWEAYKDLALGSGLRACWSTPIQDTNSELIGTFAMYYSTPKNPTPRELEMTKLATHVASIAIESNRLKQKALEATQNLEENLLRKNRFIAMLGHELRNPLAVIASGASILENGIASKHEQNEVIMAISRQVEHSGKLLNDLLESSRISFNKLAVNCDVVDIRRFLANLIADQKKLTENENHKLTLNTPDNPVWCSIDQDRLTQCLVNLIRNSVKYSPKHGSIAVTLSRNLEENKVVITIEDDGIGISDEILSRIFEPFESGNEDLSKNDDHGLGLGLYIAKSIIHLHSGHISAASKGLGRGAQFTITLPSAAPMETTKDSLTDVKSKKVIARKVLLIEDNLDLQLLTKIILENAGYKVSTASSGETGIELAQRLLPEVVLCDIGLSGRMDGYDVAKSLRSFDHLKPLYITALTGFGQKSEVQKTRDAGFDYHATKPISSEKLVSIVEDMPKFQCT